MINHVILVGRIGTDLNLRKADSGVSVLSFRLAVDRDYRDKDGVRNTDWFTIFVKGNRADFIASNFCKGDMIMVEGRLQERKFLDANGKTKSTISVSLESSYFVDHKKKEPDYPFSFEGLPDDELK